VAAFEPVDILSRKHYDEKMRYLNHHLQV